MKACHNLVRMYKQVVRNGVLPLKREYIDRCINEGLLCKQLEWYHGSVAFISYLGDEGFFILYKVLILKELFVITHLKGRIK